MREYRVLGPLEVRRDGRTLELRGSKRRTVLALLVLHANEVVRAERLIDELWGEHPPANASAALHNHVSRLRKELGAEALVTKPWGYVLRCDPEALDVKRFENLLAEAKPLAAHERRAKLVEALALWRGPVLADLEHEPALAVEIARLEELRLSTLEQRIDADLELGGDEQLVPELEAMVGEHPLREHLRGQLILALYRSGRQAEALETYRETRRVLVEELGIEPSLELRELEQAILRQDPSLASAPAPLSPQDGAPPPARWHWPRSPLALAAVLLLLAAAGVAAALLVSRGGTAPPPAGAAVAISWPSLGPLRGSSTSHPEQVRVVTSASSGATVPAHRSGAKSRARAGVSKSQPTEGPAIAHSAASSRDRQPSGGSSSAPPTRTKGKHAGWVYWLADDFNDPWFDSILWNQGTFGAGVHAAEQNRRLEFSLDEDTVPDNADGVYAYYATNCLLEGDFDAAVHFALVRWPDANGLRMVLGAAFTSPTQWLAVERAGGQANGTPERYTTNLGAGAWPRTEDTTGALRLRRKGGVVSGYYRYHKIWVNLGSEASPGPARLKITLTSTGGPNQGGTHGALAAFDNFRATAESVDCQDTTPPPRKRRR